MITQDEQRAIESAQATYESKLRLRAVDRSVEIVRAMQIAAGKSPGYLWAVWGDARESCVRYALNPGYQVRARYWGPYTEEQLLEWAHAQYQFALEPAEVNKPTGSLAPNASVDN